MAVTSTPVLPGLPALPDPAAEAVLGSGLLEELSYAFGGPFHFLLPDAFDRNLAALRAVLAEAGLDGQVYYAKKANKAAVWVERCAEHGAGVDVASAGELREALGHGVRGEDLVVTGPAKNPELLRLAVRQGALIAVDSLDELDTVVMTALGGRARPARVLLRVLPAAQPHSRFGLTGDELEAALHRCAKAGPALRTEGFSFHLSGYDIQARADVAGTAIGLCLRARALGLEADRISVGGGLPISYTDAASWQEFLGTQHSGHYHARKSFGTGDFYPYHSRVSGAGALRALLAAHPEGHDRALADLLRESGTALLLEPGRALLDRAGGSVFRIQGVKERAGYLLLTVDGTSLSLSEQWFASEYLPDPRLISPDADRTGVARTEVRTEDRTGVRTEARSGAAEGPAGAHRAAVGAATCLESDMLSWRKITFPRRPRDGDLLVYPNTAGYQMDSNESPFHDLPLPPKVVIDHTDRPRPRWRLDRHFH
ncbi:Y4yA family PLP-dependent enzyme [Streptomyces sp. NPDC000594]|uniref:Y4yA family PLP-dependent enzyme n=1 Tax=Streptomyces sp. NPDC000594 TaxID=3154261 RepID=UPI0033207DCC